MRTLISNGTIVTADGSTEADVLIDGETVAQIGRDLAVLLGALERRFAVFFRFDLTNKPSQQRLAMEEVGLFTVENGKIVREEFFYSVG